MIKKVLTYKNSDYDIKISNSKLLRSNVNITVTHKESGDSIKVWRRQASEKQVLDMFNGIEKEIRIELEEDNKRFERNIKAYENKQKRLGNNIPFKEPTWNNPIIININHKKMYTLDCKYYKKEFETIDQLVEIVLEDGVDPSLQILNDGKPTGEYVTDFLME